MKTKYTQKENDTPIVHLPVMVDEVCAGLQLSAGDICVDMTVGYGGHAVAICNATAPDGVYIGIDRDTEALEATADRLSAYAERVTLLHASFSTAENVLETADIHGAHAFLMDLGVSSPQLDVAERGFSFTKDAPLDMRMDMTQACTAADIVNTYPEKELARILWEYGDERLSRQIAYSICRQRRSQWITRTDELAGIVAAEYLKRGKKRGRIHPATRTFQAIRIEVNDEMKELEAGLATAMKMVFPGGRICVLSYHSGEDRVVKHFFKKHAGKDAVGSILTKKPRMASPQEMEKNPRARSAKLRMFEKSNKMKNGESQ